MRGCLLSHILCNRIVLLDELIDGHEASSHSDHKIVALEIHDHLVLKEAVVTFWLSHEQRLHSLVWDALVDELSQLAVDFIIFVRHVFEVDLVQFVPVFDHLLILEVSRLEMLHHLNVLFHLGLILFYGFLHLLHALLILAYLVLQAVNLRLICLGHPGCGLILLGPPLQVQVLRSYV